MTCIVALKSNNRIYMGGDCAACGDTSIDHRLDPKVFINKDMLFGFTSSFRMGQILRYKLKIPKNNKNDDFEYMCTDFIDSVIHSFEDFGYGKIESNQKFGGMFVIGYNKNIYTVYSDYQVAKQSSEYVSIGIGAPLANGSLYTTSFYDFDPIERIKLALSAAEYHNSNVTSPFCVLEL